MKINKKIIKSHKPTRNPIRIKADDKEIEVEE